MLELGNVEYMFSPWLLEWAQIFMKKHEFLRSAFTSLEAVDLSKNTNNGFAFRRNLNGTFH